MSTGRSSDARAAVAKYWSSDAASYTICIARPPRTYDGAHEHGISDALGCAQRFGDAGGRAVRRLGNAELARDLLESTPIFRDVDGIGRRSQDLHTGRFEWSRQLERCLSAELDDHTSGCSRATTSSTSSKVNGSKYSLSEVSKSVDTVSGFE
jgi:hypothetical protein